VIPHEFVVAAVEALRSRRLIRADFGAMRLESRRIVKEQLGPHVPTRYPG
jgi:hypothetical protein